MQFFSAINDAIFSQVLVFLQYEIKTFGFLVRYWKAWENQMKDEPEKRALIFKSEGVFLSEMSIEEEKK